jgi:transposase-like protein
MALGDEDLSPNGQNQSALFVTFGTLKVVATARLRQLSQRLDDARETVARLRAEIIAAKRELRERERHAVEFRRRARRPLGHVKRARRPPLITCPFCSSPLVAATASDIRLSRQLTDYRCDGCAKSWAEVTGKHQPVDPGALR